MTTHYLSSRGAVEISTMNHRHAEMALAKLRREAPERVEEIEALAKHVADQPEAGVGHNQPPEDETVKPSPQSWDAIKLHMDDLLEQVNGITGVKIETPEMAAQNATLLRNVQRAIKDANAARDEEKAPFAEKVNEIQSRFNVYTAPIKNKTPGLLSKAETALENQALPWLRKLADERRAREDEARRIAEKAAEEARQAHHEALKADDLDAFDDAEAAMQESEQANIELRRAEKAKASLKVEGERAVSLRKVWRATRIEGEAGKALGWIAKHYRAETIEFIERMAARAVRDGVRDIPGIKVFEEEVL